jgi:hypothetical protein
MTMNRIALLVLTAAVTFSAPVFADNDPSLQDIYDQAKSGHLDQAQQMINQVLRDHPGSGKAHYVAAELDARQGNLSLGRVEFGKAQQLDPGLTFARPEAVRSLQAELGLTTATFGTRQLVEPVVPVRHSFPWGAVLIAVIAIGVLWAIFRRRSTYAVAGGGGYPARVGPMGGAPGYGPNPGYGPGYGPGPGYGAPSGGGIGSGIVGGLASGLAVGAGVVAGEEVAHHFLDGGERHDGFAAAPQETPISNPGNGNGDMGGSDFGVNDPGSWDDSSGGSGGGGGDWGDGGGGGGSDWT